MSTTFVQDETSTVDVEKAGRMMLQDILVMQEPERTHYLKAWIDAGQYDDNGGMVKLRNPDRKKVEIPFGGKGKVMVFPYTGKEVSRINALTILREYGENGYYYGKDQATGMSRDAYEALQHREPEVAAQYAKRKLNFNEHYLEQVPYGGDEEVEEPTE